jgi:glycerol-3-phosphate O-acyltransferase/dihydroxyacetone phosphate acyltransferase
MLRLTAKATQFGHRTFTSWLIESAGTVPIKRRKDYVDSSTVDNTEVMEKLMEVCCSCFESVISPYLARQALELGDAVCLFPEGMSRYHPGIAPFKTGGLVSLLS